MIALIYIREWTGLSYTKAKRKAQDRIAWKGIVKKGAEVVANRQTVMAAAR